MAATRVPIPLDMSGAELGRFWEKVRVGAPDECWPWQASHCGNGYGKLGLRKRIYKASRVAYAISTGEDPGDLLVCHHCDNPPCCNPAHLFLGTNTDNLRDMSAKGRANPPGWREDNHPSRRLTSQIVRDIRRRYAGGGVLQRELAEEHGVSQVAISAILRRKTWSAA